MIPKVIHYCWFGGNPLPELALKCIDSWKKWCPDYKIVEWNESNFDLNVCDFVKEAYEAKKWAFVSDYARLYIVYHEGGIYLDTDVELIKSLDPLLEHKSYLAEETSGYINTGLGFGAEKENPLIGELLDEYKNRHFLIKKDVYDMVPCPRKNTAPLYKYGYRFSGQSIWEGACTTVYPPEYFCPQNHETKAEKITENTYSIHHFSALWIPEDVKELEARIAQMEKNTNRAAAFFIRLNMRFQFAKEKDEVRTIVEFIAKKIIQKSALKKYE